MSLYSYPCGIVTQISTTLYQTKAIPPSIQDSNIRRSDHHKPRQQHRRQKHRQRHTDARRGRRVLRLALHRRDERLLRPAKSIARRRERRDVALGERLRVGRFDEDEVEGLLEDLESVDADGRRDEGEVFVDLVCGQGCRGGVAGDVDVVHLRDCGGEFGDVEGYGGLHGDGEAADGGDEEDGGLEGEGDGEV